MSNELDKHFKEKLGQYASEVDAEALWQAVRPPRRKRRVLAWWPLFGGLLLGAGAALWLWPIGARDANAVPASAPHVSTAAPVVAQAAQAGVGEEHPASTTLSPNTADAQPMPAATYQGASTAAAMDSDSRRDGEASQVGPERTAEVGAAERAGTGGGAVSRLKRDESGTPGRRPIGLAGTPSTPHSEDHLALEPIVGSGDVEEVRDRAAVEAVLPLAVLRWPLLADVRRDVALPAVELAAKRKGRPSPYFVQLDAAYYALRHELSSDSLPGWMAIRQATERPLEAVAVDVSAGYLHKRGWQVRTGVGYTRLNTEMAGTATRVAVDSVEGLQAIVFLPGSAVDSIYGSIAARTTTTAERRTFNSFRQVEIPIWVGYQYERGAWSVLAEGGLRLRLQRRWEGTIQDASGAFVDWAAQDDYRTGLGYSLQGGVSVGYALHPQWRVSAGVVGQYQPQDFTTATAGFRENFQLVGIAVGMRYRF